MFCFGKQNSFLTNQIKPVQSYNLPRRHEMEEGQQSELLMLAKNYNIDIEMSRKNLKNAFELTNRPC